jgi:hypothetical protein
MASIVKICNMALSHIGSSATISAINPPDGSVEAGHCSTFYDQARTELLEPGAWQFSLTRETLAMVTNESTQWLYAYALPSTCMRALRVLTPAVGLTVFNEDERDFVANDRTSADFDIEGTVLFSNHEDASLVFVRDITDSGKFTASFTAALSYLLASYLAGPIVKGTEGMKIGDGMRQRAMSLADTAATASANASSQLNDWMPGSIRARS